MTTEITVSAPGRICLFGEHQDFLGLSVIACPLNLCITLTGRPRDDLNFTIDLPDLGDCDHLDGACELEYRHRRDYLRSATNVLRRAGLRLVRGYDCSVRGNIPINAGTSSSSALVVAWTTFLLTTQEGNLSDTPEDIAHYAYEAEVVEFGEPGGMMDHYTSAVGGLLHIDCREPITVTHLPTQLDGFVLGETGLPKKTTETLKLSRDAAREGIRILQEHLPHFDLRRTPLAQTEKVIHLMPEEVRRPLRAQLKNRDLCLEARAMLSDPTRLDPYRLGAMLYEHQQHLREGVGVSHPMLDKLVDAAMAAGALGGKLNGSGCGGCMFAYAPGRQEEVKAAIDAAGGRGHIVTVGEGVTVRQREVAN